ncbi:MAG TPA: hypothetical protein VGM77_12855 [Gemmatimonadales bacterium]|jgi:hypothetical protein
MVFLTATALDLRAQLAQRFPDAVPLPGRREAGLRTGIEAFDNALPNNGLPRGRPTIWATPGAGATAILMATVHQLLATGQRAAWIDGSRMLGLGWPDGPLMLRPRTALLGLRFAELLLESGGFALVVLSGVPVERTTLFRLARATHEGGGAFALLTEGTLPAALRVRSRYVTERIRYQPTPFGDPARLTSVTVAIDAVASGWQRNTTLTLPLDTHDVRCALDSGLADRRGGE